MPYVAAAMGMLSASAYPGGQPIAACFKAAAKSRCSKRDQPAGLNDGHMTRRGGRDQPIIVAGGRTDAYVHACLVAVRRKREQAKCQIACDTIAMLSGER
jgi:tRNA U38,U39,U40 pseudouridine synthase TruA